MSLKYSFSRVADTLPAELAAAKRSGMPLEPEDLRREVSFSDQDNAAEGYRRAIGLKSQANQLQPKDYSKDRDDVTSGRATPEQEALVKAGMGRYDACLAIATKAAGLPGVDWHRQWEKGSALLLPEYSDLKEITKIFATRAVLEAKAGQKERALADIDTIFKIGHHTGSEPILIANLVQISIESIGFATLEKVLNASPASALELQEAAKIVASLKDLPSVRLALGGEMVMNRQTIHGIRSMKEFTPEGNEPSMAAMDWLLRDPVYRKAWEAKAVHYQRLSYDAIPVKNPTLQELKTAMAALETAVASDNSIENKMNQMILPVFGGLPDAISRAIANRRTTAESIAILQVRLATGHLPKSLPITGDAGTDPYSMKPLRYKPFGTGFKVYSVDSDLVDDGGLTRQEDKKGKSNTHDLARTFK